MWISGSSLIKASHVRHVLLHMSANKQCYVLGNDCLTKNTSGWTGLPRKRLLQRPLLVVQNTLQQNHVWNKHCFEIQIHVIGCSFMLRHGYLKRCRWQRLQVATSSLSPCCEQRFFGGTWPPQPKWSTIGNPLMSIWMSGKGAAESS